VAIGGVGQIQGAGFLNDDKAVGLVRQKLPGQHSWSVTADLADGQWHWCFDKPGDIVLIKQNRMATDLPAGEPQRALWALVFRAYEIDKAVGFNTAVACRGQKSMIGAGE